VYVVKKTIDKKNVGTREIDRQLDRYINKKLTKEKRRSKIDFDLLEETFSRCIMLDG